MNLNDLDKRNAAIKALKENFDFDFNISSLSKSQTKTFLNKVVRLIKEAKASPDFYRNQENAAYMKLVFMAQALNEHYKTAVETRIIVENEQVEKSQVILAAQDMIDSVQKMIEDVNDMLVKELPALTDSIQSQIGVNESAAFNKAATEALSSLNETLTQARSSMQNAMNQMTGVESAAGFDMGDEAAPEADLDAEMPEEPEAEVDIDVEEPESGEEELPDLGDLEDLEPAPRKKSGPTGVGREKR